MFPAMLKGTLISLLIQPGSSQQKILLKLNTWRMVTMVFITSAVTLLHPIDVSLLALTVVLCLIAALAGLCVIKNERTTELTIANVGNIKAADPQATIDGQKISDLKERVALEAATIDLIAKGAAEATRIKEVPTVT
jgi:hypothetical protein